MCARPAPCDTASRRGLGRLEGTHLLGSRIALALRLLAALAVGATVVVLAEPATALTVPETLADRRPVQAGPVTSAFPIDSLGVIWDAPHDHADEHAGSHGAVRFRTDGTWGPWIDLVEDGAAAEGQWASALVDGGDADAYQVRGLPASARSARAVAINTTDGPAVKVGERRGGAAGALASTACRSRADWGADESLRFKDGKEVWPAQHNPLQTLTVHHTATANGETGDAAAARLRSIYRYHAVDRGWGDIGYQYLIDAAGVVYEGRWSGTASASCAAGGDGSDFGHADDDQMVGGAHVGGYNSGNMGVSLLGTFTKGGAAPTASAVDGLEAVLAELGTRHGLDPEGTVTYVNPVNGYRKTVPTISAHRDWEATECPGDRLYSQLPDIRTAVAAAMADDTTGSTTTSTTTSTTSTTTTAPTTTTTVPQATLAVTGMTPENLPVGKTSVDVAGTGFVAGATVTFVNGKGNTPIAGPTTLVDGMLRTTVTVQAKGPKGPWDVVVTLPDGRKDVCPGCAYVER